METFRIIPTNFEANSNMNLIHCLNMPKRKILTIDVFSEINNKKVRK